jgi:hypothetical protein
MWLSRLRLYATNAFIGVILLIIAIDILPQSPGALSTAVAPFAARLGINQGPWSLFAPEPDRINTILKAEITYRDGEKREWQGPNWRDVSAWQKWIGHRRREWLDHMGLQVGAPAWEPWCRYLARQMRPELADAERGAEVRMIYREATTPAAELYPWSSFRTPAKFDDGWVLTIEKFP